MAQPFKILILKLILVVLVCSCHSPKIILSNLEENFLNPPQEAKPKTWMHAMSGNMTEEGITKDLEAMAEVGIGGLLLFNITQGIPNGPVSYNSPEHHEMIQHAAMEAERLGLSFGVHNCDGWSSSGGPWVTPEESMKMVVWSETITHGGAISIELPEPTKREGLYEDIAVITYPSLNSEISDRTNTAIISASDPTLDITIISDSKIDNESRLSKTGENDPWIQYSFSEPKTIQSVKVVFNDRNSKVVLQTSSEGIDFFDNRELFKVRTGKSEWAVNDHFEALTSKYFRLKFNQETTIKEAQLSSNYNINNLLGRTSIARTENDKFDPIGSPENFMIVDKSSIKNLSGFLGNDGMLKTVLPEGMWTILRFGYTSTGAFNNPASDAGRGLEVDKLNRTAFKKFFEGFVKKVINNSKPIAPNALKYIEIDSYEMGGQNWTNNLDSVFSSKKGYDIKVFLPLIAGRFIESSETSEAVLSDFREIISDLMTENYYAYFTELCHEAGLISYIEPYGLGPLNDLDIGGKADIPMGEFWMNRPITQTSSSVSSAHIYGKPVISAESFTSTPEINWKGNPAMAKTSGDLAWTYGINEFMFHRFAHQANPNVEPGMTMNRWGFHFDRTQTWWKNAGAAWFKYIARGSYLLRQGNPVSDLLVYVGEGSPNGSYHRNDFKPEIPETINFDNVNTDVLTNRIQIKNNTLVLPEGTEYKALVLKNCKIISLPTLKRILDIVNNGIPVVGEAPEKIAGYNNSEADRAQFKELASKLSSMIGEVSDWHTFLAMNRITPDLKVNLGDPIDYVHRKTKNEDIYFFFNADTLKTRTFDLSFRIRNKIPELWNPMTGEMIKKPNFTGSGEVTTTTFDLKAGESTFVVFRENASGLQTLLKKTDSIDFSLSEKNIMATVSNNGSYRIPLSSGESWEIRVSDIPKPVEIKGDWEISFKKSSGYGGTIKLESLMDWKDHSNDSIKYYSGTATYSKIISIPEEAVEDNMKTNLDLGEVYIVAEVWLNGKRIAVSWMPPFQLDISEHVKAGENTLKIELTNQWSNRLIGEERYPANDGDYQLGPHGPTDLTMPAWYTHNKPRPSGERTTFTTAPFYKQNDPLMPSGLLGPVFLRFSKQISHDTKE